MEPSRSLSAPAGGMLWIFGSGTVRRVSGALIPKETYSAVHRLAGRVSPDIQQIESSRGHR